MFYSLIQLYMKIRRYFFNFDTIMKKFSKASLKMEKFNAEMRKEAKEIKLMITALENKKEATEAEIARSRRVAKRIAEFLS